MSAQGGLVRPPVVTPLGERTAVPSDDKLPVPPKLAYQPDTVSFPEAVTISPLMPIVSGGPAGIYTLGVGEELPAGLTFDPQTGEVSGTPTQLLPPTIYNVTATNGGGQSNTTLTIEIFGVAPASLDYAPIDLVAEIRSGPHYVVPTITGGPVDAFENVGAPLPVGIVLDPDTGTLSGIPRILHPPTIHTISASNETGSTTANFLIDISLPTPPSALTYTPPGPHFFTLDPIGPLTPTVTGRVDVYTVSPPLPNRNITTSGGQVLSRTGVLIPDNQSPISYTPPEQTFIHPWQVLNVWLPAGNPPVTGWPVLLSNPSGGYFGAPPYDNLDPTDPIQLLFHKAINEGFAVVFAGVVSSSPVTGWFYPPGHPSGLWEDPDHLMPEKDVLHALQWVKIQNSYPLDINRIFLHGSSAGATISAWVGLNGELGVPSAGEQLQQTSRVAGILCFDTLFSFPAYDSNDTILAHHWESTSMPGWDAIDMGDADQDILDANSVARVILDPTSNAATTPVFLAYDCGSSSVDYTNDPDQFPALRDQVGMNFHDLWHGAKLWERLLYLNRPFHLTRSQFYISNPFQGQLGSLAGASTGNFPGLVLDSAVLYDEALGWMRVRARETIADPSGLQIHPKSGLIYGKPNLPQPTSIYQIMAINPGGSTSTTISVEVDRSSSNDGF